MARLRKLPPGAKRLPDGRIRLRVATQAGGKYRDRKTTLPEHATRKEVLAGLAELQAKLHSAAPQQTPLALLTVEAYAHRWLKQRVKRGELSGKSAEVRGQVLGSHVLPMMGSLAINELSPAVIRAWVDGLPLRRMSNGRRYARPTVEGWWRILKAFVKDACAEAGLPDPTYRIRLGGDAGDSTPRRETEVPTRDEVARLLEYINEREPQWYPIAFMALNTGMRSGELIELRGMDIDERAGMVRVRRSYNKEGGVKAPKSRAGMRDWPLTDEIAAVLLPSRPRPDDLLLPSPDGSRIDSQAFYKAMVRCSDRCGLSVVVTPQVCRRYVNTALVDGGVDAETIRSLIGHTSLTMTRNYTGARIPAKRLAVVGALKGGGDDE